MFFRYIRFIIIAFISFLIAINETFFRKIILILLCGLINLNSPIGYVLFNDNNKASAALPPSNTNLITQVNENKVEIKDKIYNPQLDTSLEVAQIPRVRQNNSQFINSQPSSISERLCRYSGQYVVFAQRPNNAKWENWQPPPRGTFSDRNNIELAHEHIFFCDNGRIIDNVGYGLVNASNAGLREIIFGGPGTRYSYPDNGIPTDFVLIDDEHYDSTIIREILGTNQCRIDEKKYGLRTNNCQDFTNRIRQEYWRRIFASNQKKITNERSGKQVQGTSYGDPHLITFDGHRYSFQTVGEFILAKSTDGDFEVQTRQTPVNKSLSLNSAVAMKVGRNRVAFYSQNFPDSDTNTPLRINGQPTVVQGNLSIPGGGKIYKQDESNYVVEWPTGEKVTVTIYSRGQFKYMDVFPFVFESQANQMVGLLGNVNSNVNDDLRFRSGQLLPTKSTYGDLKQLLQGISPVRLPLAQLEKIYLDQLNKDFGNSWRVSQAESLFDYPPGKSTANFTDKAFPDAYLTLDMLSPTQLQNASSQCLQAGVDASLLEGCIFDVGFTGFSEFAYHTAKVSNILDIVESVIPGFKNPIPELLRQIPKIPGLNF